MRFQYRVLVMPLVGLINGFWPPAFAVDLPNSGNQIQQIPPSPTVQKVVPPLDLTLAPQVTDAAADSQAIQIQELKFTGATKYSSEALTTAAGFTPGSMLSLNDLRTMAGKITEHYRKNGYFVAFANIPAQDIIGGGVQITIYEGKYGTITINNNSRVRDVTVQGLIKDIKADDVIAAAPLENGLLLLADLPGLKLSTTLSAGSVVNTSNLDINIDSGPRVTGSVDADNAGNRYTGRERIGATIYLNELTGFGDVATLRVLSSFQGLDFARATYQAQFGKAKVGLSYTALSYKLGREFKSLENNGSARIASVFGSYPFIRSRRANLMGQWSWSDSTFIDRQDAVTPALSSRKTTRVWNIGLSADRLDEFGRGGANTAYINWSHGVLDLQTDAVRAFDASSARSNGTYNKMNVGLTREQSLGNAFSLYAAYNGQYAINNLDASEKSSLGGIGGVRAYPSGEVNADSTQTLTVELRKQISARFQVIGFVDSGKATINYKPWAAVTTPNHRTLSGAGVGVNWFGRDRLVVRSYLATRLGSEPVTSAPDSSSRFWLQAVRYF